MTLLSRLWAIGLTLLIVCCTPAPGPLQSDAGKPTGKDAAHTDSGKPHDAGRDAGTNHAPTADAGPNQGVDVHDEVTLDGSGSTDPDGDALAFTWTIVAQPEGAEVSLSERTAIRPKFKATKDGNYIFELVVSDAQLSSAPDRVTISTSENQPPVANAGKNIRAKVGDKIALDGSLSMDPNGDKLTFAWKFTKRPKTSDAALSDAMAIKPMFTVDVEGEYELELVVNDGTFDSEPDSIIVSTLNLPPTAEIAVATDSIFVDQTVSLDGTGSSDPEGAALTYHWSLTAPKQSSAKLKDKDKANPSFVPDVRGDYLLQLIVNDGVNDSEPVTQLVAPENREPTANAGADTNGQVNVALHLDGTESEDPDHDELTFAWSFGTRPSGSHAKLSNSDTAAPSFTPDVAGDYVVKLLVNDGDVDSDADSVTVAVANVVTPPSAVVIDSLSPTTGPSGTVVTVTGHGFTSQPEPVHVFVTTATGEIEVPIVSISDTEIQFILPPGATTGSVAVQFGEDRVQSADTLTVEPSSRFELDIEPSALPLNPGVSVSAIVRLGTTTGFADLADLTVEGLPDGVTATIVPQKIRAGDWALLTLQADAYVASSDVDITVSASAEVDTVTKSEVGQLTLHLLPTTTAFVGRTVLDDPRETPLAGVTVTLLGKDGNAGSTNCQATTQSDAAGNFFFTNLPSGCTNTQLVRYDGLTVTTPAGQYAGVDLANDIAAGMATQAKALVHLPRIDTAPTVGVQQNAPTDQVFTFPGIPNMELTVYAGTTLTMPDGSTPDPFPLIAVPVPVDRLPEEVPETQPGFHFFIIAFQPANAIASQPVAVTYPNELAFAPGTAMPLLTLDPELGVMVQYGTGKVSDDGLKILPDADPAFPGRNYGIVHFDWHGPFTNQTPPVKVPPPPPPPPPPPVQPQQCTVPPESPGSVDYSTGVEQHVMTDIGLGGGRGAIGIARSYRTFNTNVGPFGIGTAHNYHYQLSVQSLTGATFNLVQPNGNVLPFARQPDGTYVNQSDPSVVGAVFRTVSGGSELLMPDGTILGFAAFPRMGGSMLTSITDTNGNRVVVARNASAPFALTTVTDPVGRQLVFTNDSSGRTTSIADPLGRRVSYAYNSAGYLATVTDVLGGNTSYTYTANGELATIVDARGATVVSLTYDANGRASSETLLGYGTTTFQYAVINQSMPTSPVVATTVTDPLGSISTYRFNPQGFVISATDPLGQTNTLTREGGTNRVLQTQGSGACGTCSATTGFHRFVYNAIGQVTSQTDEVGATFQTQYEPALARPTSVQDPLGNVTSFSYDARGNLTQVTDALNRSSAYEYDANGQVTAVVDADGQRATLSYDGVGNLVSVTDPKGNVSRMRYDGASRLVETIDPLGRRSKIRYDAANRVTETTDPGGAITKFTYDSIGNITSVTDARGAVTQYAYDTAGRLTTRTDPLSASEQYGYDSIGRLSQYINRRGQASTYAYDTLHRLTRATYADSTVDYSYDAQSNVATIADSQTGAYRFSYDVRNLLSSMQGPNGAVSYAHDLLGRVTTETPLGQPDTLYTYNAVGQYTRIETTGAGVAYGYDAAGKLATETRENGVVTHYTYDVDGSVIGVRHELNGSDIDVQSYEQDASGATAHVEEDSLQPLATPEVTATYDLGNRIQTWDTKSFTHDADGNRLQVSDGNGTESYAWDARGRLSSITQPDGTLIQLSYDFAGNLSRISTAAGDETQFTGATGNVLLRRTANGTLQRMLSGLALDHHVALLDGSQGVRYPLQTRPNTTIATVDAGGVVDGQYSYEPYGKTSAVRALNVDYPFLFTGRSRVTSDLYYYRARFYDPVTSRFVSEDPLGFGAGDANLYGYVRERPVNWIDPSGADDVYLGLNFQAVLGAGATLGFGFVRDTDNLLDSGFYISRSPASGDVLTNAVGLAFQAQVLAGYTTGELEGTALVGSASLGVGGEVRVAIDDNGNFGGIGMSRGKLGFDFDQNGLQGSATYTVGPAIGVSASVQRTSTWTIRDAMRMLGLEPTPGSVLNGISIPCDAAR